MKDADGIERIETMGHTPGPWEWEVADRSAMGLGTKGAALMEGCVLIVERCKSCQKSDKLCMWPKKEDAALIASAPDLLFAAKQALRALEEGYDAPKIRDDLRNAIARAKGRE